jgi:hypothetical protein
MQNVLRIVRIAIALLTLSYSSLVFSATNAAVEIFLPGAEIPYKVAESTEILMHQVLTNGPLGARFKLGLRLFAISNYVDAFKEFERSAQSGYPEATFAMSICYREGLGVKQNYEKSRDFLRMSTWTPSLNALNVEAKLFDKENRLLRISNLGLAATFGDVLGIRTLRELSPRMTEDEHQLAFSYGGTGKCFQGITQFLVKTGVSDAFQDFINKQQVQDICELKLRSSGLKVLQENANLPVVYVVLEGILSESKETVIWELTVSCIDTAVYRHNRVRVHLYNDGAFGQLGKDKRDSLYGKIERNVASFCNAVLKDQE